MAVLLRWSCSISGIQLTKKDIVVVALVDGEGRLIQFPGQLRLWDAVGVALQHHRGTTSVELCRRTHLNAWGHCKYINVYKICEESFAALSCQLHSSIRK